MKRLLTILFLLSYSVSWGQGQKFTYGANNGRVYVLGDILFPKYATTDSNLVIGLDANGNIVMRTKGGGSTPVTIDSALYVTITRLRDSLRNVRLAIPDTTHLHNNFANYVPLSGGNMLGDINSNGYRFIDANPPTADDQLANKGYVDALASGLRVTDIAKVATADVLDGAYTYDVNYPYTITFDNLGACPLIDNYQSEYNDAVLIKDEIGEDSIVNGLYRCKDVGSDTTYCTFVRDSNTNSSFLLQHALVPISTQYGAVNKGGAWVQSNPGIVLNETAIEFTQFPFVFYVWGYGLVNVASNVYIDTSKVITPYRITQGFSIANTHQIDFLDNSENQLMILNKNGPSVQNSAGNTSVDYRYYGQDYNQSSGSISIKARNATGANTWYWAKDGGTVADSAKVFARADSNTLKNPITLSYFNSHSASVDSSIYATQYRVDTGVRNTRTWSLATFLTSSSISGKVNYTDTANMLAAYLRKVDTATLSNRINLKVNYTDTVTLSNRINLKQNFTDTTTWDATKSYVATALTNSGYANSGTLISTITYSAAGTYTVTVPANTRYMIVKGYGAGGGSAACVGGSSIQSFSAGGASGTPFDHVCGTWSTVVVTVGAAGSAGVVSACPSCVASNGGQGGSTTFSNGTTTTTAPGGLGSIAVAATNANRSLSGAEPGGQATNASLLNGFGVQGGDAYQYGALVPNSASGRGGYIPGIGLGGVPVRTITTAGNAGTGNASGGGGCMSGPATGLANAVNGAAGTAGRIDIWFYN